MILSPELTTVIGNMFKTNEANARVAITEATDEAEVELVRPAHRLVRINSDGFTVGYTEGVVLAKAGQLSDQGGTDHALTGRSTSKHPKNGGG